MSDKVKVAVRVRPLNRREQSLGIKCIVDMRDGQTILYKSSAADHQQPKSFAFDHCFWSFDPADSHFASQTDVYREIGAHLLDNAVDGYNACIFAYGQTGSGKSYTMMGSKEDRGLIPRLCDDLFERVAVAESGGASSIEVEVSYMEIYNEKVHDLLDPSGGKQQLRVREHNIMGTYVENLSKHAVTSYDKINELMAQGNKSRTVAATNMNSESSRSHAVFNITITCITNDSTTGLRGERMSKISLVDLAGSERATKTGAVGGRLKEGSNINKSLTTLGMVISKLAEGKTSSQFIPYRDSVLTWLLKDKLGGNSKTVMVATISPAADNYEETLSTLRYADRAKRIVNHAVINEDPNDKLIRQLKQQVEELKARLVQAQSADVSARLQESESLMKEISQPWEEKVKQTEQVHIQRQQALEKMGISVEADGIKVEKDKFYLVNLNADPSLNEMLLFNIKKEYTLVGRPDIPQALANASTDSDPHSEAEEHRQQPDIHLFGIGIQPEHCVLRIENGEELWIEPVEGARTCVNGAVLTARRLLRNGDRIFWGNHHFFRVTCPQKQPPSQQQHSQLLTQSISSGVPAAVEPPIDYQFAREELMLQELSNDPIQTAIATLERQHEDDKNLALEKQRQMYEKQLQILREQMSPTTPYAPYVGLERAAQESWAKEREHLFKVSLAKLREQTAAANDLVREANLLAKQLNKNTTFRVTLQIPAASLTPNRKRSAFVSEPAILVSRPGMSSQVWSMEKLENKLIDMRELFSESGASLPPNPELRKDFDPFFESQENHSLIGVANMFLKAVFHDVKLAYQVPIISQHGEVAGRLHMEICRTQGSMDRMADCNGSSSSSSNSSNHTGAAQGLSAITFGQGHLATVPTAANGSAAMSTNVSASQLGTAPALAFCLAGSNSGNLCQNSVMETSACSVASSGSGGEVATVMSSSQRFVRIRVTIKEATGLPAALCNFVFCQYSFWGNNVSVAPSDGAGANDASAAKSSSETGANSAGGGNAAFLGIQAGPGVIRFDHSKEFDFAVTEDFVEYCLEGALSVEVFGHTSFGYSKRQKNSDFENANAPQNTTCKQNDRNAGGDGSDGGDGTVHLLPHPSGGIFARSSVNGDDPTSRPASTSDIHVGHSDLGAANEHSLAARWDELKRKLELWLEIHELNENGEYAPVEVVARADAATGGVFQLRQGQQRRLVVAVSPVANSGTLPLSCDGITHVSVGGLCVRKVGLQKPLDSYQDDDLRTLRDRWVSVLDKRKQYLHEQLVKLSSKEEKTNDECERERQLFDAWMRLQDERDAVYTPRPGSRVPGAPVADWTAAAAAGMELHTPVLFLDLSSDDMARGDLPLAASCAPLHAHHHQHQQQQQQQQRQKQQQKLLQQPGANAILSKELASAHYSLPIVRSDDNRAVAAWDSSIHDSPLLNAVTGAHDRVYLILRASVRLSHPVAVDIVLRKRFAINVYKRQTITERIRRRLSGPPILHRSGVTYEIVGSIPKACEDLEGRETLALMAAQGLDDVASDGESYIEKYTKIVISVESILNLDKLRQDVAIKELLHSQGRPLRKTLSVPNIAQSMSTSMTSSMIKQNIMSHSMYDESTSSNCTGSISSNAGAVVASALSAHNGTLSHNSSFGDGLDKVKEVANAINDSPSSGSHTGNQKIKPLRPLIEENLESGSFLSQADEDQDYTLFKRSVTSDSTEPKSLVSSGYGSQALSTEESPTR